MAETGQVDTERMQVYVGTALSMRVDETVNNMDLAIRGMQMAGMTDEQIKAVLLNDLNNAGRIFGTFRTGVRTILKEAVQLASTDGSLQKYGEAKVKRWKWIVVSQNPCPDCIRRHGRVETMAHWRDVGLPGSGFSICQQFCQCRLVPGTYTGAGLENPVIRQRKKK